MSYDTALVTLDQAQAALDDGHIDEAIAHYQSVIAGGGPHEASAFFGLASCHARRKQWKDAEDALNQVIERSPEFAVAYAYRGAVRLELAAVDDCLKDLDTAVEMAPNDAVVHVKRAEVFLRLGLLPAAHDEVRQAAKLPAPDVAFRDYMRAFKLGVEKELKRSVPREVPPINWGWLRGPRWLRRNGTVAPTSPSR
ncbi:MAG TPA: tetratricopeptide repeat protein [Ktedonobacterales bacterium]|nr:tetratricopeptide repeat protein [Ktedonobacterales bacterium]